MKKLSLLLSALLLVGCTAQNPEDRCLTTAQFQNQLDLFDYPQIRESYYNGYAKGLEECNSCEPEIVIETVIEQSPRCLAIEEEMKLRKSNLNRDALEFCKMLMFGRGGSNVMVPNLYEAIGKSSGENNNINPGSLEDRIMSHVLLVLIECFQNT